MRVWDQSRENFATLEAELGRLSEKHLYELREFSHLLYERIKNDPLGEEAEMRLREFADAAAFSSLAEKNTPSGYLSLLCARRESLVAESFAATAIFLAEHIRAKHGEILPWRQEQTERTRIAYVPTNVSDQAFFALTSLRQASVLYTDSSREAFDALRGGRADYALLPYMSKGELLPGTVQLLSAHELSLCALVFVPQKDGDLAYALLSSKNAPYILTDSMHLSLRLTAESYAHFGRMLSLLSLFGYLQTDLVWEREEYGRVCGRVTLTGEGDALALWIYLSLYSAGFASLGRYPIIVAKER